MRFSGFGCRRSSEEHVDTWHQKQCNGNQYNQASDSPYCHGLEHIPALLNVESEWDEAHYDRDSCHKPRTQPDLGGGNHRVEGRELVSDS